ncbi:MBL fold metallo-hydrolase [Sphingobacterium faecale]|uniref:MBL fold metallo-hydrolase n=1 Tax=Sphingobacterium faecale TaxID=2803775 RepID=A0ABS1R8D0_9SPHI|nr:MBL fold metallo-hydrolase [Sphingobacterium faecale]MBL1410242.1 MBL fold metallo-hydrolase [Sphingobacterium faecale]
MKYAAIASGSNGNCYYVAKGEDVVLVDIGINTKHVELRMAKLGLSPVGIKAIFITHEHGDHIRGLSVFCKRYQIPVYLTEGTYKGTKLRLPEHLVHIIHADARTAVGELTVIGIPKYHDAKEPCSFVITDGTTNVSILTDLGRGCDNVKHVIQHSDVLLLESNYDEEMLRTGRYSYYLKNRISSGWGHISNREALELLLENRSPRLRHLILGHLSGENNTVDIVEQTFAPHCEEIELSIALRTEETPLYEYVPVMQTISRFVYVEQQITLTQF